MTMRGILPRTERLLRRWLIAHGCGLGVHPQFQGSASWILVHSLEFHLAAHAPTTCPELLVPSFCCSLHAWERTRSHRACLICYADTSRPLPGMQRAAEARDKKLASMDLLEAMTRQGSICSRMEHCREGLLVSGTLSLNPKPLNPKPSDTNNRQAKAHFGHMGAAKGYNGKGKDYQSKGGKGKGKGRWAQHGQSNQDFCAVSSYV